MLSKLEGEGVLTDTGRSFLIAAMDPFHDDPVKSRGWPDVEVATSVVRCIKQSVTITKPAALSSEGWDCFIVQWPWLSSFQFSVAARSNHLIEAVSAPGPTIGGLQAWAGNPNEELSFATTSSEAQLVLDPIYTSGANRIVGMGFEVTNTTAEIYKQGLCTSWRMDGTARSPTLWTRPNSDPDPPTPLVYFTGTPVRRPPVTLAEAMLIPGTKQWSAAEGTYMVTSFVGDENPPTMPNYTQPVLYNTAEEDETGVVPNTGQVIVAAALDQTPFGLLFPCFQVYPIHTSGTYFTGLSDQTSLVLTQIVYLETFPTPAQKDILVLGEPSAEYDPAALELFSHCMRGLPVACMVKENPLGEWFAEAVEAASDFLLPLADISGIPGLSTVVQGTGKMAKRYLENERRPLPPPPPPPPQAALQPRKPRARPPKSPAVLNAQAQMSGKRRARQRKRDAARLAKQRA